MCFTVLSIALDWDDSQTDLAHLGGAAPGAAKSGGDRLWEDNWDDDDVEDPFSAQLRCVLNSILYTSFSISRSRRTFMIDTTSGHTNLRI